MMKRFLVGLFFLCLATPVRAATLYFGATSQEQRPGNAWAVGVFIDTQGARTNAVEGEIEYEADRWSAESMETGSSSVTLWIEAPALPEDCAKTCHIPFRGVIPGGLVGNRLELFRLAGRSIHPGQVTMTALDVHVLAHDGQGTELPIKVAPLSIRVATGVEAEPYLRPSDTDPPVPFTVQVAQDALIFDGKWFAVFETQDKGSGVDRYEWQEASGDPDPTAWKKAERPQLLEDQSRNKRVYVRAIDRMGNIRVATEVVSRRFAFMSLRNVLFLGGVLLILLLIWSRFRARSTKGGE